MLVIEGAHGPLFTVAATGAAVAYLTAHYPQFRKRSLGWRLSVEELHLLLSRPLPPVAEENSGELAAQMVRFASADVEDHFNALRARHERDCALYAALTCEHGYKLRHGSQFGANYIGYQDVGAHGECLLFAGPLSHLERVRAARIARSVGKRAVVVLAEAAADGTGYAVALSELPGGASPDGERRRKSRRTE